MIVQTPALWAFEEDILSRSWLDWLAAHTSFLKPLHRYEGSLTIEPNSLQLAGIDRRTKDELLLVVYKYEMQQLYLGFDESFNAMEARGLTWLPLRLTFEKEEQTAKLYLIINYRLGMSDNQEYFEFLQKWLSQR